jgi:hypothetical protein
MSLFVEGRKSGMLVCLRHKSEREREGGANHGSLEIEVTAALAGSTHGQAGFTHVIRANEQPFVTSNFVLTVEAVLRVHRFSAADCEELSAPARFEQFQSPVLEHAKHSP